MMNRVILPDQMTQRAWQLCLVGIPTSADQIPLETRIEACRNLVCLSGKCDQEVFNQIISSRGSRIDPHTPPFTAMVLAGLSLPAVLPPSKFPDLSIWALGLLTVKISWIEQFLVSSSSAQYSEAKKVIAKLVTRMKALPKEDLRIFREALTELVDSSGEPLAVSVGKVQEFMKTFE